jgi:hypothetical protein
MASINSIILNDTQLKASILINKFLQSDENKFLLLGCAGSGKTTVITYAFTNSIMKIAFCAFTNKATQVLKTISDKFHINFNAEFFTIHKLLSLEPKYLDNESELSFIFTKNKLEHLRNYDVIIFDECSTISAELYNYISQAYDYMLFAHNHKLKFIFLGDYWQLPPIGEDISVIFTESRLHNWPIAKLTKVMRSKNDQITTLNTSLLNYIDMFRYASESKNRESIDNFIIEYPYNLITDKSHYLHNAVDLYDIYLDTMKNKTQDIIILTYSNVNCIKTNHAIQDRIDAIASRDSNRTYLRFYPGDRCCIDKPIEVFNISTILDESNKQLYTIISNTTNTHIYNGEIFDIINTEDTNIKTMLNYAKYGTPPYFPAQILDIRRITDNSIFRIIHIDKSHILDARKKIRPRVYRSEYINLMTSFIKIFPSLSYGYCITLYKSQGSEYNTVLINLLSIKYSLTQNKTTIVEKKALLRATYTALSRASHVVNVLWY